MVVNLVDTDCSFEHGERAARKKRIVTSIDNPLGNCLRPAPLIAVLRPLGSPAKCVCFRPVQIVRKAKTRKELYGCRGYPDVELMVICGTSPKLLALVEDGKLDLAIVSDQEKSEGKTLIFEDELVWVAGPRMHVGAKDTLQLAFMPVGCEFRGRALTALDKAGRHGELR